MAGGTVMNQMTDGAFGKKKGGPQMERENVFLSEIITDERFNKS